MSRFLIPTELPRTCNSGPSEEPMEDTQGGVEIMAKKLVAIFALTAVIFSLTAIGLAQESTVKGNLAGVVSDPSGAVVAGAKVVITGPTGERSMDTDAEGRFLFQVLIPGYYKVKISKEGFKSAEVRQAEVVTGRTSNVSLKLELGASATTIEVSA